jgi:MFS family permease
MAKSSLLTDVASEMLYPVIPIYLASIGYGALAIGFIEGIAEAITGLSKGYFGYLSDKYQKPALFVRIGYGLSALTKPFIGLTAFLPLIFGARVADRFGKSIRSASRDALLSQESASENRGKVFGFHRSMDTLGATLGPILALLLLFVFPGNFQLIFVLAIIPGILAVALTFLIKDKPKTQTQNMEKKPEKPKISFKQFWQTMATPTYKRLLIGFGLLALLNSSDMFLILRAREMGLSDTWAIGVYILFNLVYTFVAFPVGWLGDKLGFKKLFLAGIIVFAITYALMARELSIPFVILAFALYGFFPAINEVVSKSWLSVQLPKEVQGTGLGLLMTVTAGALLLSSIATGALWQFFGSTLTFTLLSTASLAVFAYFILQKFPEKKDK